MKKYFNIDDISHLTQYVHNKNATDEMVKNYFEYMANSYKDELDKLAYAELIKKTIKNMTHLEDHINKNIYKLIYGEFDLNKVAKYYKLSENLAYDEDVDLLDNFKEDQEIYPFDELWDRMDNELRNFGMDANLYLLSDLLQMDKNIKWVKLNAYERVEAIRDINKEFEDWLSSQDLENYLSEYDKDDFIDEFELEEKLEKEKLEDKKEKALIM